MSHLAENLDDALAKCAKCGFCLAGCPVFTDGEPTSPRAKVRLARAVYAGQLELTDKVKAQAMRCLNCRACAVECPSGVEPNRIALALRSRIVQRDGLPFLKKLAFVAALPHPRASAWASRFLGAAQHVFGLDLQNNPLRLLFPHLGLRADRDIPPFGRRTFMAGLPGEIEPDGPQKTRVVFFPGCAVNLLYPEIGLASVRVLRRLGAQVLLPRSLVCCSTPVFTSGDIDGARKLAERNLRTFHALDFDYIVTACGSCGLTIKQEWAELLGIENAERIGSKVLDIAEFAFRFASGNALDVLVDDEVFTYHDSCHLRRGMGVWQEPRELLRAALGERFVEMESADRCCGGGGTFSLEHPELSQDVAEHKMRSFASSGAQTIATGCPACVMQLRDSLVHRRMCGRVVHTAQIIDRAMRKA